MYFGYAQIWRFTFVPLGFVIVMATFVALCAVYLVGASTNARTAARYLTWTLRLFGVAIVADVVFAIASGQLGVFVASFGISPLFEMVVLAFLCVGSMGFMASKYVASKASGEARASGFDASEPNEGGVSDGA